MLSIFEELDNYDTSGDPSQSAIKDIIRDHVEVSGVSVFDVRSSGHVTASAFCYNLSTGKFLMQRHRALDLWLPFGGHAELGEAPCQTASREFTEEAGVSEFRLLSNRGRPILLDLDVHSIPAKGKLNSHFHLDFRYLVLIDAQNPRIAACDGEVKECVWMESNSMLTLIKPNLKRYLLGCLKRTRLLQQ